MVWTPGPSPRALVVEPATCPQPFKFGHIEWKTKQILVADIILGEIRCISGVSCSRKSNQGHLLYDLVSYDYRTEVASLGSVQCCLLDTPVQTDYSSIQITLVL